MATGTTKDADRWRRTRAPRLSPTLRVGISCFIVAGAVNLILLHQVGLSGDEPYYARIANHPAGPHNFPYAFRIGVPYLVHVLPFAHSFSWRFLALLFAAIAAGGMYALLREFDIGENLSLWLAICFVVSPPLLVVFLRNGISVDPAAVMVITLGCLFIVRRKLWLLTATLVCATVVHESCLFLIPLAYAFWADRFVDARALRDVCLVAILPVVIYVYIRVSIIAVGEIYQPGYNGAFLTERIDVIRDALRGSGWRTEIRRLFIDYGPLWAAAPFALRDLRFARRGLVLVMLCVGSMTFALDWGRMAFFAAPVIYAAAAYTLRNRRRLAILAIAGLLILDVGYAIYMQVHGVKHGLDSTAPPARGPVS
jgi:hypothetical protein